MAGELVSATQLVAAGAIFALAGWLLVLNFESRLHRSLAFLLFLRAMVIALNRAIALDPDRYTFWLGAREWFYLALLPAVAYFAATLIFPRRSVAGRYARGAALAVGLAAEALYLADHCLATCPSADDLSELGPLMLLIDGFPMGVALLALGLAIAAFRATAPRRAALGIAATGFLLWAALDASVAVAAFGRLGPAVYTVGFVPSLWAGLVFPLRMSAMVPVIAAAVLLARVARAEDRSPLLPTVPVALALVSGLYLGSDPVAGARPTAIALAGLWLLALPLCLAYAILKHRLFDIDARMRVGLRRGAMTGAFLLTFLVVSEVAQNWLDAAYGLTIGGAATGLLLFTMKPLDRLADRLARAALPHAASVGTLSAQARVSLFRDQATVAWEDGVITRKERALLDQLRERLDIPPDVAAKLESEAARPRNDAG